MARVTVKYKCGDRVQIKHNTTTDGIVTAIFIRGRGRVYEVSYTYNGEPTCKNCEEVELRRMSGAEDFGFKTRKE